MNSKTTAAVALALAVAAVGYSIWRHKQAGAPPDWYQQQAVEKMDMKTYAAMTKTRAEWMRLGQENGRYRNPETGEHEMVDAVVCASCGKKIPLPPGSDMGYKCPLCGKAAVLAP